MAWFAVGPAAGGALTARQIRYGGIAADVTAPAGEQAVDVTAAVGDDPQSFVGRVFTVPGGAVHAPAQETAADRRALLYGIAQKGYRDIQPHWEGLAGNIGSNIATRATAKWIYSTTALLDIIANSDYMNRLGQPVPIERAARDAVVESWRSFIEDEGGVQTWYEVMTADLTGVATDWRGFRIVAGRMIYCDVVTPDTGAWRTPDGSSSVLHNNNTFPTGFTTETPTLRTST